MEDNISQMHGSYGIRYAISKEPGLDYGGYDEYCFVAQDILDMIHLEYPETKDVFDFQTVFSQLEDKYKCYINIETPEGLISMLCVTIKALDIIQDVICNVPIDPLWQAYEPSENVWFNVNPKLSKKVNTPNIKENEKTKPFEWLINTGKNHPPKVPTKKAEMRIELALEASLTAKEIKTQRQVRCDAGIADIVTPDTIYEIKDVLTESKLQKAVAQVIAYRACINPSAKMAVVGKRHNKPIRTKFAENLGVEIIFWED